MTAEAQDKTESPEVQQRGALSAQGAEVADYSSSDALPTLTDQHGVALTPRGLYIGATGDLKVDMADGTTGITFKAVPVGVLPISVVRVWHTGTTAAMSILFLY